MKKNGIVRSLEAPDTKRKNAVVVEPLSSMECAGCSQTCSKRNSYITAVNSRNLPIKINSLVKVASSKKQEAVEAFISLFFPVIMAIAGYFLSNPIYRLISGWIKKDSAFNAVCPEGAKALIVIIFFAVAVIAVLALTRSKLLLVYPEITDVLEPEN